MVKEKTYNPTKSRIRAIRLGPLVNLAITCRHCEDPACVTACPKEALSQEEKTGVIMIDEEKCNGCSWCIEACPFGAMMLHPKKGVVSTCDNCKDLGEPQCVMWCPEEALEFVTADTLAQKSRQTAVKQLVNATEKAASEHL
jgi:carbon-monoxide dehydrogenase iron sulfur subunit